MRKEIIINPDTGELIATYPGSDNEDILRACQAMLDMVKGPKVGDYLRTIDSKLLRFTMDNSDSLQAYFGGSFYLGKGVCDYSGSCGDSYRKYRMVETGQRKEGSVWFFDQDQWGAGRGHDTKAVFNVWEEIPDILLNPTQWKQCSKAATTRMRQAAEFWGGADKVHLSANY